VSRLDEEELPPLPTLAGIVRRFGRQFLFDVLAPLLAFVALNSTIGLAWAIAAATGWSVGLIGLRWRRGRTAGPLIWCSLGFALVRGAAGILTGSDEVYFGPAVATDFLIAAGFVGSVALGRPAVGRIATVFYPFPDDVRHHRAYRRAFGRLTLAWAALVATIGVVQVVLLATTSANTFVIVRALATWPLIVGLFVCSLRYPPRVFAREPDLAPRFAAAGAKAAQAVR
jgi:intracellular septation protein A